MGEVGTEKEPLLANEDLEGDPGAGENNADPAIASEEHLQVGRKSSMQSGVESQHTSYPSHEAPESPLLVRLKRDVPTCLFAALVATVFQVACVGVYHVFNMWWALLVVWRWRLLAGANRQDLVLLVGGLKTFGLVAMYEGKDMEDEDQIVNYSLGMIVGGLSGFVGGMVVASALHSYWTIMGVEAFTNIDPYADAPGKLSDSGTIYFQSGAHVVSSLAGRAAIYSYGAESFYSCVAPVGVRMTKGPISYWAVDENCCNAFGEDTQVKYTCPGWNEGWRGGVLLSPHSTLDQAVENALKASQGKIQPGRRRVFLSILKDPNEKQQRLLRKSLFAASVTSVLVPLLILL